MAGEDVRRRVAGSGQGLRQELGILLFGEIHILVRQHFRDHIHAEFAAVGKAHGKVMPQPVEGPELGRQARRLAEAVNRCAVFAHLAVFAGKNIGAAGEMLVTPCHLVLQQFFHQGTHADGEGFSALGITQADELEIEGHVIILQFEHLAAPHPGKKGQQEHIAHIAGGPCAGTIQKAASFFRRQMLNDLIVLDGHFDLKGKIGATVGLDAKIDNAPQKFKGIPECGRFALA